MHIEWASAIEREQTQPSGRVDLIGFRSGLRVDSFPFVDSFVLYMSAELADGDVFTPQEISVYVLYPEPPRKEMCVFSSRLELMAGESEDNRAEVHSIKLQIPLTITWPRMGLFSIDVRVNGVSSFQFRYPVKRIGT